VIGVNTFKKLTHKFEGLGFAVPIERVHQVFGEQLSAAARQEERERARATTAAKPRSAPGAASPLTTGANEVADG